MRYVNPRMTVIPLVIAALPIWADTLALRDGKIIQGTFLGASVKQVEFLPSSGQSLTVPVDTVLSVKFSQPPVAAAKPAAKSAIVPGGTPFRVRTIDPIDVDSTQAGAKFRGSLDDPIMLGGDVMVPRGANVVLVAAKVQQGGKMKGSD